MPADSVGQKEHQGPQRPEHADPTSRERPWSKGWAFAHPSCGQKRTRRVRWERQAFSDVAFALRVFKCLDDRKYGIILEREVSIPTHEKGSSSRGSLEHDCASVGAKCLPGISLALFLSVRAHTGFWPERMDVLVLLSGRIALLTSTRDKVTKCRSLPRTRRWARGSMIRWKRIRCNKGV